MGAMSRMRSPSRFARIVLGVAVTACAGALWACGSSSESDGTATGSASTASSAATGSTASAPAADSALSAAQKALELGYAGDFEPPPTSGPKAVTGKNVWVISCGQAFEACVTQSAAFKEAGEKLGWRVTIQDGKADPTVASTLIRQAVAAKVDGIAVAYFDCPGVKSALLDARTAKVPVVTSGSLDCDNAAYKGNDDPLYTAAVNLRGSTDAAEFYADWARARANYVIATTNGTGNVLSIYENSQAIQQANGKAFAEQMATCTGCTVAEVPFSFAQVPNPATLQWKSAILAHPKANVVANGIDALMGLGLQSAITQAARPGLVVDGGEGNGGNLDLIRGGVQHSSTAMPYEWIFWGLADTLNRVFAGDDPSTFPSQGAGWQYVDKDHNLPPAGQPYEVPVDFRAAYEKIWLG